MPPMSVRDLKATYEMLVNFRTAILHNKWDGSDAQAVAMGLMMVGNMEGQYRAQLERAVEQDKATAAKAREAINKAGGVVVH